MKKYLILLLSVTVFFSCKKETINTTPAAPSFTLLTKIDGNTFHPGDQVIIRWKATGYPLGSVIDAVILHNAAGLGAEGQDLAVDQTIQTTLNPGTPNDGEAIYTLPAVGDPFYNFAGIPYGNNFQIDFRVEYPRASGEWGADDAGAIQTNFFTIVPDGCMAAIGYSTTSGKSCVVPQ